ncbi:hypothetical protein FQ377_04385 [Arthrobacter echini]|uniref:Uncharacterized protein n=1 Tax=Arthrobacter echini TaxID=1529066 RepID=A0A5D0XV86_9MICC|nr:hypothetical protein [Arthrobacter echini]TYD00664.1 hypothetical protein FQ377_04385 [Arthrobacter echini]
MTGMTIQWAALALCAMAAAVRIPGALRGHGRTMCAALLLLTLAVGLSIAPVYNPVDALLGRFNGANLLLRLTLYAVFVLLGVRVAAAFASSLARRLVVGPFGLAILGLTVAATLYFFVASELPFSSVGLGAFEDQATVREYAAVGRLYPGYVAACMVLPTGLSVFDRRSRPIHRVAGALLSSSFLLVVVFVVLRLTPLELLDWNVILPFSAIVLLVLGLGLIWLSHMIARRHSVQDNGLS